MRIVMSVKLAALLAAIVVLGLTIPAGLSGTAVAYIDGSCLFYGPVTLCCQHVPAGTLITAWLDDPVTGPSWTTFTEACDITGRSSYAIRIPLDDPNTPEKDGAVDGEKVYFSITWEDSSVIVATSATWRRIGHEYHPLREGILGDADLDGVVTRDDIDKVQEMIRGEAPFNPCADANQDGYPNSADITAIRRILAAQQP